MRILANKLLSRAHFSFFFFPTKIFLEKKRKEEKKISQKIFFLLPTFHRGSTQIIPP